MAVIDSPARRLSSVERLPLNTGWELAACQPGELIGPGSDGLRGLAWLPAATLGTVASILRSAGRWTLNDTERFEARDWWYRLHFEVPEAGCGEAADTIVGFDGLATVADVWLNGQHLLSSDNMFVAHVRRVRLPAGVNELLLRFKSLDTLLQVRRPRPRWRTPMIEHQQLRWFRTTLLGHAPGWSPPAAPVGPWRPIWIESDAPLACEDPRLHAGVDGDAGVLQMHGRLVLRPGVQVDSVVLVLSRAGRSLRHEAAVRLQGNGLAVEAALNVPQVDLWWPHTHGEPALYSARLQVQLAGAASPLDLPLGNVGFRTVQLDRDAGGFAIRINGERIFCRGACWTPPDVVRLDTTAGDAAQALEQVAAAGMNMLRVGGTMVYENAAFLDACDARGVLVWQDFMFGNMDYPEQDEAFRASVIREAQQQLATLAEHPCLAVLCGNSEVEQQAAMWGAPRVNWAQPLFEELLPGLCAALAPGVPYWPSSAHGGAFPHQGNTGTTSYYGVGAYLRPVTDARRAEVRFATECLAFANVPEESMLRELARTGSAKVHSPSWKARVPRDLGAGWDFDDVRDHYLREVFDVDPLAVRYADHDRYLDLSRATTGEVMAGALREWRRGRSGCNGALLWFLRDLWPGAGWGIVDSAGEPKSGYYCLARLLQPRTVFITDEGGNGLYAHLINETGHELAGLLEITLIQANGRMAHHQLPVSVPARGSLELPVACVLEGFSDLSYAYRFGPAPYEAVRAGLLDGDGAELAHDFHFLQGHRRLAMTDPGLTANAQVLPDGDLCVSIRAERLARFVTLRISGYWPEDQYFHLAPAATRQIRMRRCGTQQDVSGEVHALNASSAQRVRFDH